MIHSLFVEEKEIKKKVDYDVVAILKTAGILFLVLVVEFICISFITSRSSELWFYGWLFAVPSILLLMIIISFFAPKGTGYRIFYRWAGFILLLLYLITLPVTFIMLVMASPPYR